MAKSRRTMGTCSLDSRVFLSLSLSFRGCCYSNWRDTVASFFPLRNRSEQPRALVRELFLFSSKLRHDARLFKVKRIGKYFSCSICSAWQHGSFYQTPSFYTCENGVKFQILEMNNRMIFIKISFTCKKSCH